MVKHKDVQPHTPRVRLLTIWFGANDACLPGFRQHVPLSRFSENITTMVRSIRSPESPWYSPETKVFLITPPPIHVPSMREDMQPTRAFDVTKVYAEEVKSVGEAEKVPVVDAWTGVWEAAGENKEAVKAFLTDGLHLGKAGYEVSTNSQIDFCYNDTRPHTGRICRFGNSYNSTIPRALPSESSKHLSIFGLLPQPHSRRVQGRELARHETSMK
jgi:GDSL-like Lipase/Acylhydrolase family